MMYYNLKKMLKISIFLTLLTSVFMHKDCLSCEPEQENATGKKRPTETILVSQTDKKPKFEQNYKLIKPVNGYYVSSGNEDRPYQKRRIKKSQYASSELDELVKLSWLSVGPVFKGVKWFETGNCYKRRIDDQYCVVSKNDETGNWFYTFKNKANLDEFQSLELALSALFNNNKDEILRSGR